MRIILALLIVLSVATSGAFAQPRALTDGEMDAITAGGAGDGGGLAAVAAAQAAVDEAEFVPPRRGKWWKSVVDHPGKKSEKTRSKATVKVHQEVHQDRSGPGKNTVKVHQDRSGPGKNAVRVSAGQRHKK